jgi:thiol-disulfide isomerase/thioredoxin
VKQGLARLVALQLALVGVYIGVEAMRTDEAPFRAERLDEPAPALPWARPDGRGELPDGLVVVHFWATWCVPCRTELPSLLEAARAEGVPLLAVSDEPWPEIARFVGAPVPAPIVRDPKGDAARRWRVSGLPDTFVVRKGRVVARIGGALDWSTRSARQLLRR